MKSIISISVDSDVIHRARMLNMKLSPTINQILKNMVESRIDMNDDSIDIERELEEIKKAKSELVAKEQELVNMKISKEEKEKKEQKEQLERAKIKAEMWKRSGVLERV
jgi:hypothetical protein